MGRAPVLSQFTSSYDRKRDELRFLAFKTKNRALRVEPWSLHEIPRLRPRMINASCESARASAGYPPVAKSAGACSRSTGMT